MSTRSRTRSGAIPTPKASNGSNLVPSKRTRKASSQVIKPEPELPATSEKEGEEPKHTKRSVKAQSSKRSTSKAGEDLIQCSCKAGDDGTPMISCAECKQWYHFRCVDLNDVEASDILTYICPACATSTGRQPIMRWETSDAIQPSTSTVKPPESTKIRRQKGAKYQVDHLSESEDEPSSEDEYVGEVVKPKGKRQTQRIHLPSDSGTSDEEVQPRRRRISKVSGSPGPSATKRKHSSPNEPPPKKKKINRTDANDDPARKYCLGKLDEMFRVIFLRYPHVHNRGENMDVGNSTDASPTVEKKQEDLTEQEREEVLNNAKQFATELEHCMYDIYSEPDKQGVPAAAGKYKDRFRMLQYNLSKPDRVVIHRRIASASITPKEISVMSSTDLANEETQQHIKIAEQEALEHSILQKTTVPRAKITHKGFQDIEDVGGETLIRSNEREQEDEERRERERSARLKAVQTQQQSRQRTASMSVPPQSPVVPTPNTRWGAPPPVPVHAQSDNLHSPTTPTRTSVYTNVALDSEPEMNLADLINIDDEMPGLDSTLPSVPQPSTLSIDVAASSTSPLEGPKEQPSTPTGISPFAQKPDTPRTVSFNLDSLWVAPKALEVTDPSATPPGNPEAESAADAEESPKKDIVMEDGTQEPDDQDFDMFLDDKEMDQTSIVEAQQNAFEKQERVWTGKITMPLDSTTPQETPVIARQIGGRAIHHESLLWGTLFPNPLLRIDGRVPVESSAKFLLQIRMNVSKELIAVAFSPDSEGGDVGFRLLSDFLIAKGRHGLVFPWGQQPKESVPGRELYLIPLLSSDPVPDYMELLDDFRLPKIRKSNYLIGIWVLTKGKLGHPHATTPPTTSNYTATNFHPPIPGMVQQQLNPSSSQTPPIPVPVGSAALAAEVASLTPEQIQMMIRTLASTTPLPISGVTPPQAYHHSPPPPPLIPSPQAQMSHGHSPVVPPPQHQQHWGNTAPPGYPGAVYSYPESRPHHTAPYSQPDYDRRAEYPRDAQRGSYDQDQGWRGGGGNRAGGGGGGRGRGRGRGFRDEAPQKPLDSGWPRRPRNEGPGPSSPNGDQPRW